MSDPNFPPSDDPDATMMIQAITFPIFWVIPFSLPARVKTQ